MPEITDLAYLIELYIKAIDENLGDGYAKSHPELLAALHQAGATLHLAAAIQNHPCQEINLNEPLGSIAESLEKIGEEIERLNERQGIAANSLLRLSDVHGTSTPGPF